MYSEELMTYLYSYNLPKDESKNKEVKKETLKAYKKADMPLMHVLKSAFATVPVDLGHERM